MKKITMLLSLLITASMISCTKDDTNVATPNEEILADKAYVTISISAPTTRTASNTYEGEKDGTADESAVNTLNLLTFDGEDKFVEMITVDAVTSGTTFSTIEVDPSVKGFLAVVNAPSSIKVGATVQAGSAWTEIKSELTTEAQEITAAELTGSGESFMMINDGAYANSTNTILVRVTADLSMDKTNPTAVTIAVDRLVSRFESATGESFTATSETNGFFAEINGYSLNATNKSTFLYSTINKITASGDDLDYRTDPNMYLSEDTYEAALTWLNNTKDEANFVSSGYLYTLENTAGSSYHNYINLTQAIVKATILPTELQIDMDGGKASQAVGSLGTSWFAISIDGIYVPMTLEGVQAYYSALSTGDPIIDQMDAQFGFLKAANTTAVTATGWSDVTMAMLDAIPYGGYEAATVEDQENYVVQYFQKGLCYYDVFIQHDSKEAVGDLGRWGMVRNNAYSMTVNSITKMGYPYIPDPTDEDIVDPANPDPSDPEPADPEDAYINAVISVNPWSTWSQENDL